MNPLRTKANFKKRFKKFIHRNEKKNVLLHFCLQAWKAFQSWTSASRVQCSGFCKLFSMLRSIPRYGLSVMGKEEGQRDYKFVLGNVTLTPKAVDQAL